MREYPYLSLAIFGAIAGDVAEHYQAEARQAEATAQLFAKLDKEKKA